MEYYTISLLKSQTGKYFFSFFVSACKIHHKKWSQYNEKPAKNRVTGNNAAGNVKNGRNPHYGEKKTTSPRPFFYNAVTSRKVPILPPSNPALYHIPKPDPTVMRR